MSEKSMKPIDRTLLCFQCNRRSFSVTLNSMPLGLRIQQWKVVDFNVVSSKTFSFETELVQMLEIEAIDNDLKDRQ